MPKRNETLFMKRTQITLTWPDGRQQVFPVADVTSIGRGPGNLISIPEQFISVSRRHLELRQDKDRYYLKDLGSINGVFLNGQKVNEAQLKDGDEISIGQADLEQQIRIGFQLGTELMLSDLAADTRSDVSAMSQLITQAPADQPHFRIRWPNGSTSYFAIQKERIVIGRDSAADLELPEKYRFVSNQHAEILKQDSGYVVADLNSTNGTLLNNQRLQPGVAVPLINGSILRIGDDTLGVSIGLTFVEPVEPESSIDGFMQLSQATRFAQTQTVLIGRAPDCDVILSSPEVSRKHASIRQEGETFFLKDLNSRNGTLLNDQPIKETEIKDGNLIQISNYLLLFQDGKLIPYQSNGMRLDVSNLSKDIGSFGKKRRIIEGINLSILPREFVAVVGGSGAGKTTLLNALIGIRPGEGQVNLNGYDFYKEYDHFRSSLGYVPQSDILHTSLTVEKALDYTARLRLPKSLDLKERNRLIAAVLETVSMNTDQIRKTKIRSLSGGQRKRVSIAAELLADPKLIYLDEATSGLDPGLEKKLMHTLRRLADEGRTVILVTHATNNIVQTDHVAFISQGKLVYFGPSSEALPFFEVEEFADIYERIERHGEEWRQTYETKKPAAFNKYVKERLAGASSVPKRALKDIHFGVSDFIRQLIVLTQRSLSVLFSDPITMLLMLLLLPITGTLQLVIGSQDILTGNLAILADPVAAAKTMLENYVPFARTNTFVFVMGLEAVLTGLFVPSNDLVKERSIYLRERMVNLKVLPYLMSKAVIYSLFVVVQVILYLLIISLGVDLPAQGLYMPGWLELFITLFLTMMAGITFGLIISAVSGSTEMAIYLLTMMLFFQFFFAGTVFDLRGNAFEPVSYLSTTRWSLTALGVTIDMPKIVDSTILCSEIPTDPFNPGGDTKTVCANYDAASDDLMISYEKDMLLKSWGVLGGMSILFLIVTGVLLKRTDSG